MMKYSTIGTVFYIRELSPPYSRHSTSFPERWSKVRRLGAYCVLVLSQQIRTTELTQ